MLKKLVFCFTVLFSSFFLLDFAVVASPYDTVYITRTGAKYHYRDCRTLARSRQIYEITVQEAKNRGYTACKVCRPPVAENKNVHETYVAHCFAVEDGDTIKIRYKGEEQKIRFYGIDCPEKGQLFGTQAKKETEKQIKNRNVQIEVFDIDKYGRSVALVSQDELLIQENLLLAGLAWVYPKYCKIPKCAEWKQLEATAKQKKIGLWKNENSIPPWEWRKM